jgi:hypothetical protein
MPSPTTIIDLASRMTTKVKKAKKWIKAGDKHPGLFKKKAQSAGKSTAEYAEEHQHDSGKLGKEARFAQNAMKAHRLYGNGKGK